MDEFKVMTTTAQPALTIREKIKVKDIPMSVGRIFGEVVGFMQSNGVPMAGPPFVMYHSWSMEETDIECGFPVPAAVKGEGKIKAFTLPSMKAVVAMHLGPYQKLGETYGRMEKWMKSKGLQPVGCMWENYLNDPQEVAPEKLMTEIVWPVK